MINFKDVEEVFQHGLALFKEGKFDESFPHFLRITRECDQTEPNYNRYISFYGMTLVNLGNYDEGLEKCKSAARLELDDPEIFYNLAVAAQRNNQRKLALEAISRGHSIDPTYTRLLHLRRVLGVRRKPVIRFLPRNNYLNQVLGKLTYKK